MAEETAVPVTPVPAVVIPALTDTQKIEILIIQRRALSLKTTIDDLTKQHEATVAALNAAIQKIAAAIPGLKGEDYSFNLDALVIEPVKRVA
jgi:hypothetical protein